MTRSQSFQIGLSDSMAAGRVVIRVLDQPYLALARVN
jgi:hypothetical protein